MIKKILLIILISSLGLVQSEESFMKLRVYRELIEDLF